jgi:hypothetical protein
MRGFYGQIHALSLMKWELWIGFWWQWS